MVSDKPKEPKEPKTPKPPRAKKPPKSEELKSTKTEGSELSIDPQLEKEIAAAMKMAEIQFGRIQLEVLKTVQKDFDALNAQIREFMGPYMLIGYDLSNNPIEIIAASNTAERDALMERFRKVAFKINQSIIQQLGKDSYGLGQD